MKRLLVLLVLLLAIPSYAQQCSEDTQVARLSSAMIGTVPTTSYSGCTLFDDANNQYLYTASTPVAPPADPSYTMAAWFKVDSLAATQVIMAGSDTATADTIYSSVHFNVTSNTVSFRYRNGGTGYSAATTNTVSINTWHHVCAIASATDSRTVYLDGDTGNEGTNTQDITPSGIDNFVIGARVSNTVTSPLSGKIAFAAVWSIPLSEAECVSLAGGALPTDVQGASLVAYWPLTTDFTDTQETYDLSTSASSPTIDSTDGPW